MGHEQEGGVRTNRDPRAVLGRMFVRFAGSEMLTRGLAATARPDRVRILAYHDITDISRFERHLCHLSTHWSPVSGADMAAAWQGEPLPQRAVWVTFDDAYSSVIERALPLLCRYHVPATLFVCPGYVDTMTPYWWDILVQGASAGSVCDGLGRPESPTSVLVRAKSLPDSERRGLVERVASNLTASMGVEPRQPHPTSADLRAWTAAGHELGNHTWDHPCLDRCDPETQREQIRRAHAWLLERFPIATRSFAYPNGNVTSVARAVLDDLGYHLAAAFDHRIASLHGDPLCLSRLRVEGKAEIERFRSIVSGAHSAAYHAATVQAGSAAERRRRAG